MKDTEISRIFGGDNDYFDNLKRGKIGSTEEDVVDDAMQYATNFMEVFHYQANPRGQWTQPADIHCTCKLGEEKKGWGCFFGKKMSRLG